MARERRHYVARLEVEQTDRAAAASDDAIVLTTVQAANEAFKCFHLKRLDKSGLVLLPLAAQESPPLPPASIQLAGGALPSIPEISTREAEN